ncbi:anoctamin-7-like [Mytilus galloprovincialis]|uniref:anoctamin-7-like n=1 Tax=Mytilus galloprovincialis TaxID=29158 RepID=UPI003F7C04B7
MSDLFLQILILISVKPLTRFVFGTVWVWVKRVWRKIHHRSRKRKVGEVQEKLTFIQKEALKPELGEFSLEEHTEKIIQYGFLMLFAAALPIAPLIVLITNFIDKWLDARRMLWWYRRPLATIAQDTGTWYIILKFVNICGVISNGFLIGFTSSWCRHWDVYERLWIVVGFEHIVLAFKLLFDYLIPDVSPDERLMSTKVFE